MFFIGSGDNEARSLFVETPQINSEIEDLRSILALDQIEDNWKMVNIEDL